MPIRRQVRAVISPLMRGPSFLAISVPSLAGGACPHKKTPGASGLSGRQGAPRHPRPPPQNKGAGFICLTRQLPEGAVQVGACAPLPITRRISYNETSRPCKSGLGAAHINRAICAAKQSAQMVPEVRLELTRGFPQRFLRPPRLPFRHSGTKRNGYYTTLGSACGRGRKIRKH